MAKWVFVYGVACFLRSIMVIKMSNSGFVTKWLAFTCFALYFGLLLAPKFFPSFGASIITMWLAFSFIIILPLIAILGIWGIIAYCVSTMPEKPIDPISRTVGQIAVAGISTFIVFLLLGKVLPSALPSGSYDRKFDRAVWLDPASTSFTSDDMITPRQKMLAEVIKRLPGKNREELEKMLGPSLDTPYFKGDKWDLIYLTGPERDSFFGIDSEWLLIWLDEKGMYKRNSIVND